MAFRPREAVTALKGEMNSGENRCRTPGIFRRANARVKSYARNRFRGHEHHCSTVSVEIPALAKVGEGGV